MSAKRKPPRFDGIARAQAARLIQHARTNRLPMTRLISGVLDEENYIPPGDDPKRVLILPNGYRCVYTEEHQPQGTCRHLSVSVGTKGMLPTAEALRLIMLEFGFKSLSPESALAYYVEDTNVAGIQAANVVEIMV